MTPAELRALLAKATRGPWVAETDWFDCANEGIEANIVSPGAQACFQSFPIDGTKFGRNDPELEPWTEEDAAKKQAAEAKARDSQELADAKLLVAAANALPALLDVAEIAAKYMPSSDKHKRCNEPDCMRCQLIAALAKLETP